MRKALGSILSVSILCLVIPNLTEDKLAVVLSSVFEFVRGKIKASRNVPTRSRAWVVEATKRRANHWTIRTIFNEDGLHSSLSFSMASWRLDALSASASVGVRRRHCDRCELGWVFLKTSAPILACLFPKSEFFFIPESTDQVGGRKMAPHVLELRTLQLLAVRSDQLSYETN